VNGVVSLEAYYTFQVLTDPPDNGFIDSTDHHLDLVGQFFTTTAVGKVGNCARPFGALDMKGSPAPFMNPSKGVTICGWIKIPAGENISINLRSFDGGYQFELDTDGFGSLEFYVNSFDVASLPYPADEDWHFYRAWFDPVDSKCRLQIDNVGTIAVTIGSYPYVGGDGGFLELASGQAYFDETGLWNKSLSDSEVDGLWNGGAGNTYPNVPP